ncbi:hypothetical protein D3C81_1960860 [compost metagenome]
MLAGLCFLQTQDHRFRLAQHDLVSDLDLRKVFYLRAVRHHDLFPAAAFDREFTALRIHIGNGAAYDTLAGGGDHALAAPDYEYFATGRCSGRCLRILCTGGSDRQNQGEQGKAANLDIHGVSPVW